MKNSIKNLETKAVKNIEAVKGGDGNVPKVIILLTDGAANAPRP